MRFLVIASASVLLSLPAAAPASACGTAHTAKAATTTYSADEMKPPKKKPHRRAMRKPKEKVEYMRALAPEPTKK
jgi:hypothetical protein